MKKIEVKKGEILQAKGGFNSKVYKVESGLLRSYSIDEKGKEHIFMFAPEGWIIGDIVLPTEPNELFIDVIEDGEVYMIAKQPTAQSFNNEAFRKRMGVLQKRVIMLMSFSAIERYEHFEHTYPDIVQRVPQRMIASYLGVTPETLSAAKKAWYQATK